MLSSHTRLLTTSPVICSTASAPSRFRNTGSPIVRSRWRGSVRRSGQIVRTALVQLLFLLFRGYLLPEGRQPPYRLFSRVSVIRPEPSLWPVSLPIKHTIARQERDGRGSFLFDSGAGYPGSATSSAS